MNAHPTSRTDHFGLQENLPLHTHKHPHTHKYQSIIIREGRGHLPDNYTGTQSLKILLSYYIRWLNINEFQIIIVTTFIPIILIYKTGNFVYHH